MLAMNDNTYFVVAVIMTIAVPILIGVMYLNEEGTGGYSKYVLSENRTGLILDGETSVLDEPLNFQKEDDIEFDVEYVGEEKSSTFDIILNVTDYSVNVNSADILYELETVNEDGSTNLVSNGSLEKNNSDNISLIRNQKIGLGEKLKYRLYYYLSNKTIDYSSGNISLYVEVE